MVVGSVKTWSPQRFAVTYNDHENANEYAAIALNVPIRRPAIFAKVWNGARWRICADGGANRIRDLRVKLQDQQQISPPDIVCGDFDSIQKETLQFFKEQGSKIVKIHDQYTTDLMKALSQLNDLLHSQSTAGTDVVILGGLEGRVDQALSQLHQLHLSYKSKPPRIGDLFLIAQSSIIMHLAQGKHLVHAPISKKYFTKYSGLIPLAGPITLTTAGFEWNLQDEELEFGKFISTSNHVVEDKLVIETSGPTLLTLEMPTS